MLPKTKGNEKANDKAKEKPLGGKALRHLRALGHSLDPVVSVGKNGVTDALVRQVESALLVHELIKVKVQQEAPEDRREIAGEVAKRTGAVLAQVLGRTFLLYKRHPKKPKIVLPRAGAAVGAGAGAGKAAPARPAAKAEPGPDEREEEEGEEADAGDYEDEDGDEGEV